MTKVSWACVAVKAESKDSLLSPAHGTQTRLANLAGVSEALIRSALLIREYAEELLDSVIIGASYVRNSDPFYL
jgi:hypothetical protein